MDREQILAKIDEISNDLPKLPDVVAKLLQIIDDPEVSPGQIVKVLEPDPALTTRILRVANSAYYGFSQTIYEIKRAVPLIGLDMIRSLALSLGVLDGFNSEKSRTGFDRDQLWLHCLAVGAGANNLVRSLNIQAGHIFITAFLHDIGKLVLDKFFPDEFKSCMEAAAEREIPTYEAEKEIIGMDHGEVGALLLEKWQFPDVIIEPVRQHHAGESSVLLSREDLAVVRIMDALAIKAGFSAGQDQMDIPVYASDLKVLGMNEEALVQAKDGLEKSREDIQLMFAAMR